MADDTGEVAVGGGDFGAAIDEEDDVGGAVEGKAGLFEDFSGDHFVVVGDDSAGVDQFEMTAMVGGFAVDAVAGDAGFVADDGAALAEDGVE